MELLCIGEVEPLEELQGCIGLGISWRAYKISFTSGFYREYIAVSQTRKPCIHSRLSGFQSKVWAPSGVSVWAAVGLYQRRKNWGKFFDHRAYCPLSTYIVDSKKTNLVLFKIKYTIKCGSIGINLKMRVMAIWRALGFPCSYSTTTCL